MWNGGEEEGVEAELLGASARLGVAGGHGYGDDDGELRSVAGGETEERGGGRSRERGRSERGSGTSPWRREEVGEAATAKQERAEEGTRARESAREVGVAAWRLRGIQTRRGGLQHEAGGGRRRRACVQHAAASGRGGGR